MALKPGDEVRLSKIGLERWTNRNGNPTCNGTIIGFKNNWIEVRWVDGFKNSYNDENQLELVNGLAQILGPGKTEDHFIRPEDWRLYSGETRAPKTC